MISMHVRALARTHTHTHRKETSATLLAQSVQLF